MTPVPINLALTDDSRLLIEWSDGARRKYGFRALRDACPCATCREKQSAPKDPLVLPTLGAGELAPLKVTGMTPVGNYAYSIAFSDGHNTGIYPLTLLRELGEPA
ncbi:MAG TPA: DUF971 domain-containing protein [Pirellulaceae bacterium]|nr:DUF971 domain-containing protein [Pirellulaceae bacterium]